MEWYFVAAGLIPLIFCPFTLFNGFSLPQTAALSLLSALGLLAGVLMGMVPTGTPVFLSLLFLSYMLLSLLWSAPIHNAKKELGLQLPLVLLFLVACTFLTEESVKWWALVCTIVLGINSVYGRAQCWNIDPLFDNQFKAGGPTDRAIGTIGNSNFLASYYAGVIWLAVYAAVTIQISLLTIVIFSLYMIYGPIKSRAGQVGAGSSIVFFILVAAYFGKLPIVDNDFVFSLGLALLILSVIWLPCIIKDNWRTFWVKRIDPDGPQIWYSTLRYRFCYWLAALELIREKPIFGWGMWAYRKEVYRAQAQINERHPNFLKPDRYVTPQPREVHNDFLEHLVEFGIVGFVIFILFLGSIFYIGFSSLSASANFLPVLALMSGLVSILVDAFFFFALRLPSTSIVFWVLCASIVVTGGGVGVIEIGGSVVLAIIAAVCYAAFAWNTIVKRVVANRYFAIARRPHTDDTPKHQALLNAIRWAPYDTLLRTHASVATLDFEPTIANMHANMMVAYYDGQTPLNVTLFNAALARIRQRNRYDEAVPILKRSHWILPSFQPTLDLLNDPNGAEVRAKYLGGQADMRISEEKTLWHLRALIKEKENYDLQKTLLAKDQQILDERGRLADLAIQNLLLLEKKRLNIPDHWTYDAVKGCFVKPEELTPEQKPACGFMVNPEGLIVEEESNVDEGEKTDF